MDYNKIGEFIASERKAKKLTQVKLAEKLFVSEKTISKWENGNGVPDTNTLPKLCEIFDVSINELLNGERISNENYANKAESKLLELQKAKIHADRRLMIIEFVLGFSNVLSFLIILFTSLYAIKEYNLIIIPVILICLSVIIFLVSMSFCLYIEQKAGYYLCKKCNHKYVPKYKTVFFAMHNGTIRYMKCPHCKKYSWQKKVFK